jgi:hypothetical protein
MSNSSILTYDYKNNREIEIKPYTDGGIPGSPAAEGNYIFTADQLGRIYKFENTGSGSLRQLWKNPQQGDSDYGRLSNSRNLKSPTIGARYVYLPLQNYKNASSGGPGAVVAWIRRHG